MIQDNYIANNVSQDSI